MKKAILFDADDTLFDFKGCEYIALKKTMLSFGLEADDDMISLYSAINDSQWKLLEKGEITRAQVLLRRFEIFYEKIGVCFDPLETQRRYERNLGNTCIVLDGVPEMLTKLSENYRLFIISNGTAVVQDSRIELSGIKHFFEKIFISEKLGFNKPDRRFFDAVFEAVPDLAPDDCVVVGDSLTSDIKGGVSYGITTVWFNPKHSVSSDILPDHSVGSISEITELIPKL